MKTRDSNSTSLNVGMTTATPAAFQPIASKPQLAQACNGVFE